MELTGNVQGLIDLIGEGGSTVTVTPILQSGIEIMTITVDNTTYVIYAPEGGGSEVEVDPILPSGTKIATITVNGVNYDIYSPDYSGDISSLQTGLSTANSNITALQGRMTTAEGNITTLQSDMAATESIIGDGQLDIGNDLTDAVNEINQSLSTLGVGDVITFTPATNVIDVSNSDYKEGKICIINHTVNFTATAGAWFTIGTVDKIPVDVSRTYGIKPSDGSLVGMISINTNGTIQIFPSIAINSSNISFNISYRTNS